MSDLDVRADRIWEVALALHGDPELAFAEHRAADRLCTELAGSRPWAFVNINVRPYYAEGSRTLAYEVAAQLCY